MPFKLFLSVVVFGLKRLSFFTEPALTIGGPQAPKTA